MLVGLFCLFGLVMFFFGFFCCSVILVMGFIVFGMVNKFLMVVMNFVIWDKYLIFVGMVGYLICMIGGIMY